MKKSIALFISALMVFAFFTGCAKKETGSPSTPAPTSASSTTPEKSAEPAKVDKKDITITLWLTPQWKGVLDGNEPGADYDSFFKYAAQKFSEQYDNANVTVKVEVVPGEQRDEKISTSIRTGSQPDILFEGVFTVGSLSHKGVFLPVDELFDEAAKADISPEILEGCRFGDNIYIYPFFQMPGTMAYNADLFKQAGLESMMGAPDEIKTWTIDEYLTVLNTLKEKLPKDVYPMSMFAKNNQADTWNLAYLRMYGNKFFSEDGKVIINDENGLKALNYMNNLVKNGLTNPSPESVTSNDCNTLFLNQKIAISFSNSVLYNNALIDMENGTVPKFDIRLGNIPGENAPLTFTYITGSYLFDTKDADRIQVAKDFVKFYSSDPELVKSSKNGVPVRASVAEAFKAEKPIFAAYDKNAQYIFNFTGNLPGYTELRQVLFPELQAVYTGQKTPEQALADYQTGANKVLEEARKDSVLLNK